MEYHQPAAQWEIFGIPDFESYCAKLVVKGLFHPLVPKDVVDAYELAVYMMVYAYYHYPLYDEAYSKLLRITEMAVRQKCRALDIEITTVNKKGNTIERRFNDLIIDLNKKEPNKNIGNGLHWLRDMRNTMMHADSHSFSGAMTMRAIKAGVTVLNKLFIPEQTLISFQDQLAIIGQQLKPFENTPLIFIKTGYLLERIEVREAVLINGTWIYLIVLHPITTNIADQVTKHYYTEPEMFVVKDIAIDNNGVVMKIVDSGDVLQIKATTNPDNVATYNKFITDRQAAQALYNWQIMSTGMPGGKHNDFLYEWLWRHISHNREV